MKNLFTLILCCYFSTFSFSQIPASQTPQFYTGSGIMSIDNDVQFVSQVGAGLLQVTAWVDYIGGASIKVALKKHLSSNPPVILNITSAIGVYDRFVDVAMTEDQRCVIVLSHSLGGNLNKTLIPVNNAGGVYNFGTPTTQLLTSNMKSFSGVETDRGNVYIMYIEGANNDLHLDMLANYPANSPFVPTNWSNTLLSGGVNFSWSRFAVSGLSTNFNNKLIRYMVAGANTAYYVGIELTQTSPTTYNPAILWGTMTTVPAAPSFSSSNFSYYYTLDVSAPFEYDNSSGISNDQYVSTIASNTGDVYIYSPSAGAFNLLTVAFGPNAPTNPTPTSLTGYALELLYSRYCGPKYYLAVSNQFLVGAPAVTVQLDLNGNPINQYAFIDNQSPVQKIHASIAIDEGYMGLSGFWNGVPGTKLTKCLPGASWVTKKDNTGAGLAYNANHVKLNSFIIYPNPTVNLVNVESSSKETINQLVIYDVSGKVVYEKNNLETNKVRINSQKWSTGFYYVKINNSETIKIVKN